jgi:eukaryotic-like serine/threonine-protein kinase
MSGSFRTPPTAPADLQSGAIVTGQKAGDELRTGIGSRPGVEPSAGGRDAAGRDRLARGSTPVEGEPVARLRCPSCKAAFRGSFTRCMRDGSPLIRTTDDPLIGATIADRYVIEALVGEGAMGLVYRAHHARLSRLFALKLMFGDVAADASMRLRFAQEADAASRMSHPNVVSVLDFGKTENGLLYLAMEYAEGETLAALLRREGTLPERRVIALAKQMARGLGHAHRAGLVHRDFKPANVSTCAADDGNDVARILDFGLAISGGDGHRIGRLTEHGLVVGTPIYISPEQARDQVVDHRADLFALGVVMYEMLAGKPPFEGTSHEIARANVTMAPPPISQRNPQVRVSSELEAIVLKLMAKRAADRFQSADEVIAALTRLARPRPVVAAPIAAPEPPPVRPRSPVQWLLAKSAHLGWGASRAPATSLPAGAVETSAATLIDGAPGLPPGATVVDAVPFGGAVGGAAAASWTPDRDGQPTQGMTPAALHRADGVARQMRRRGVVAAAWFALATSGIVCTMMEGQRPAAGQSGNDLAPHPASTGGAEVGAAGRGLDAAALGSWAQSVYDQIRCTAEEMRLGPAKAARGRFEGKMEPARARRCPTVQNAGPTAAEQLSSSPVPSADTGRSRPSARASQPSSPRRPRPPVEHR